MKVLDQVDFDQIDGDAIPGPIAQADGDPRSLDHVGCEYCGGPVDGDGFCDDDGCRWEQENDQYEDGE